jgi:hypothetical protein
MAYEQLTFTADQIEALLGQVSGENLLHNWDFRNPVNQRGQSSYSGAGYTIDMWRLDRGSSGSTEPVVSVVSGGLSIEVADKAAFLKQFIEADLTGIPVTFSAMAGDTVYSVHCENPSTTGGEYQATENTPFGSIRFGYDAGKSRYRVTLYCNVAATTTFSCVKLERGAISTLANDPPADYGAELLKCSRYLTYIINGYQGRAAYVGTDDMHFDIPIPVPMRVQPSIVDASGLMVRSLTASVQTGFSFNVTTFGPAYLRLTASKTGHGLTDAQIFANGQVLFSAEL